MNSNVMMLSSLALAFVLQSPPQPAAKVTLDSDGEPHFVEPPGEPAGEIAELLTRATRALGTERSTADVLADPTFAPLRPYTQFRELIRVHAKSSKASLVPQDEPGTKLTVLAHVFGADGKPAADALVYAYQTSAKGWYAAEAPHISGNAGDTKHARLFAYVRSTADGSFELSTIRPAGYPRSTLPQHIHLAIDATTGELTTEIVFANDPRMTPDVHAEVVQSKFVIAETQKLEGGAERCSVEFQLRRR